MNHPLERSLAAWRSLKKLLDYHYQSFSRQIVKDFFRFSTIGTQPLDNYNLRNRVTFCPEILARRADDQFVDIRQLFAAEFGSCPLPDCGVSSVKDKGRYLSCNVKLSKFLFY
jgi:hypothetical protein